MTDSDAPAPGHPPSSHSVQLFDGQDSLAAAVCRFLFDGLVAQETVLVVSTAAHWDAILTKLGGGVSSAAARQSGQLVWRDPAHTMASFMKWGRPVPAIFSASVETLVEQLSSGGRRLRVYGEMVDLLAVEGDFRGAQALEQLWNELGQRRRFTLLCGYSSTAFGDPRSAAALRAICGAHSSVRSDPRDLLGSFLVEPYRASRGAVG